MLDEQSLRPSIGARALREGFARSAELDLWWACGYPRIAIVTDTSPKKGPVAWWTARDGLPFPGGAWPVEVVHMLVRNALEPERDTEFEAALQSAAAAGPADASIARRALDAMVDEIPEAPDPETLYAVEALIGTAATVTHLLDRLTSSDLAELAKPLSGRGTLILWLAPMLRRLAPEVHAEVVPRLEGLLAELKAAWPFGTYQRAPGLVVHHDMTAALDLVLGGAEAAIALHVRKPTEVVLTEDGTFLSGFFAGLTGERWTDVAPRAAFVAPDAVLTHYTRCWDEYPRKVQQIELVEVLSTLSDARILPWMFEMACASAAKTVAKRWFVDHREETADFVMGIRDDPKHPRRSGAAALAKKMKL